MTTQRLDQLIHPDDLAAKDHAFAAAHTSGTRYDVEYRIVRPNGEMRVVHSQGDVIRDTQGHPQRMFGTVQDITERKRAEAALRTSEARFRTLVEHATDAFFLHDRAGLVLDANEQACRSLGREREQVIGQLTSDFDAAITPKEQQRINERLDAGEIVTFETLHRRADGSVFPVEVRTRPLSEGGADYRVSLARDITERQRTEAALRDSHQLLDAVVSGTPDAVFVKDVHGHYLLANGAGTKMLGRTTAEVLGKTDDDLLPTEAATAMREREQQVIATGAGQTFEQSTTVDGQTRSHLWTLGAYRSGRSDVIGVVSIARDITDAKRMEEQFRQAQKMEAVDRFAGGLAHDFNNLLTVIHGSCELAALALPSGAPTRQFLAEIERAGERAGQLTRQLLAFSRKQVLQPQTMDLNAQLGDLHNLLRRLIGEDIELALRLDPSLGTVRVDPGQFEQAIINLAVNARDAMPGGGKLTIETCRVTIGAAPAQPHPELQPGRYVVITVHDTGHGMDSATKARIFEPFFTTKGPGKGTGLGLAMVYGFVKQSGGHVEVETTPGHGAAFRVYLPQDVSPTASRRPGPDNLQGPCGSETVLLVEDEDAVRALFRLVLRARGYQVLEARDGRDGLNIAEQHEGPIQLLVTDMVMPRMGGRQLAEQLTAARPDLRVLLLSGYAADAIGDGTSPAIRWEFLQKPFSPITLVRKVREVLDATVAN